MHYDPSGTWYRTELGQHEDTLALLWYLERTTGRRASCAPAQGRRAPITFMAATVHSNGRWLVDGQSTPVTASFWPLARDVSVRVLARDQAAALPGGDLHPRWRHGSHPIRPPPASVRHLAVVAGTLASGRRHRHPGRIPGLRGSAIASDGRLHPGSCCWRTGGPGRVSCSCRSTAGPPPEILKRLSPQKQGFDCRAVLAP